MEPKSVAPDGSYVWYRITWFVFLFFVFGFICPVKAELKLKLQERSLAKLPARATPYLAQIRSSLDQKHIAFPVRCTGGVAMCIDGREGPPYEIVTPAVWSADGQHVAYGANSADGCFVVTDGKRGKAYTGIIDEIMFSPQGEVVYVAHNGYFAFVVRGGKEYPSHEYEEKKTGIDLGTIRFSPDGTRMSYVWINPGEQRVVIDGKEEPPQPMISAGGVWFSPDGKHSVYAVHKDKESFLVYDGKRRPESYEIAPLGETAAGVTYSPFSPDGKHLVFRARTVPGERKQCVVFDHKPGKHYDGIGVEHVFSPDSKHFAYYAKDGSGMRVILNSKEQPLFDIVSSLLFSPDSAHFAYLAKRKGTSYVVLDGKEEPIEGDILATAPAFSPDSKHLLYIKTLGEKLYFVVGKTESKPYKYLSDPRSEKLVFGNWRPVFDSSNRFHFIGGRLDESFEYEFFLGEGEILETGN